MQRAQNFVDEVRSSLEFYTAQTRGARIGRVLVIGGGSKLAGLPRAPAGARSRHDRTRPRVPPCQVPTLALGRGARRGGAGAGGGRGSGHPREAFRVSQVNLLPPELRARQKTKQQTTLIIGAGAAMLVLLLGYWFLQSQKLSDVNERGRRTERSRTRRLQSADRPTPTVPAAAGRRRPPSRRCSPSAYAGEVSFSQMLMDVSRTIPSDAYLNVVQRGPHRAGGRRGAPRRPRRASSGPSRPSGAADGFESLASWLTRLESVKGWVNPWLSSATETGPEHRAVLVHQRRRSVGGRAHASRPGG